MECGLMQRKAAAIVSCMSACRYIMILVVTCIGIISDKYELHIVTMHVYTVSQKQSKLSLA